MNWGGCSLTFCEKRKHKQTYQKKPRVKKINPQSNGWLRAQTFPGNKKIQYLYAHTE